MLNVTDRFRHHGNRKLSRIRTQSTSRMSLPMSQFTSRRQRHPVHHNSSFHRSRKATKCRTSSHFHIMAAVRASVATSVTCRLPISSLRHRCHELSTWPLVGCVCLILMFQCAVSSDCAALLALNTTVFMWCHVLRVKCFPYKVHCIFENNITCLLHGILSALTVILDSLPRDAMLARYML